MGEGEPNIPRPEGPPEVPEGLANQVNAVFGPDHERLMEQLQGDLAPEAPASGHPHPEAVLDEIEATHDDEDVALNRAVDGAITGQSNPREGLGFGSLRVSAAAGRQNAIEAGQVNPDGTLSPEQRARLGDLADPVEQAFSGPEDELIVPPGFEDYNKPDQPGPGEGQPQ